MQMEIKKKVLKEFRKIDSVNTLLLEHFEASLTRENYRI